MRSARFKGELMMDVMYHLENLVMFSSYGAHVACFGSGIYRGVMSAQGSDPDVNFEYYWGANATLTGLENSKISDEKTPRAVLDGAIFGGIAAPIEHAVGFGVGWLGAWAVQ